MLTLSSRVSEAGGDQQEAEGASVRCRWRGRGPPPSGRLDELRKLPAAFVVAACGWCRVSVRRQLCQQRRHLLPDGDVYRSGAGTGARRHIKGRWRGAGDGGGASGICTSPARFTRL